VNIFEQTLLWAGLFAYVKNKKMIFAVIVCLAACFKLTPLFFLILLMIPPVDRKALLMSALLVSAFIFINYLFWPELIPEFLRRLTGHGLSIIPEDISLRACMAVCFQKIGTITSFNIPPFFVNLLWIFLGFVAVAGTYIAERRMGFSENFDSRMRNIFLCAILYIMCLPRLYVFQMISAIPASLFFVSTTSSNQRKIVLLLWLLLGSFGTWNNFLPIFYRLAPVVQHFLPTLMLTGLWFVAVFVPAEEKIPISS